MSDPDFSKLFGSSATSTSEWTDPNYLTGWGYLGQANPPYQLFDDLQKQNDTKLKWLFDKLDGTFRLNSTPYVVGDIKTSESMPSYMYAECTVAGTSGTSEPTWGTTIGATVTDGTATWLLKNKGNNIPYNQQIYSTAGTYTFTAPISGLYKVIIIGGGGGSGFSQSSTTYVCATGGGGGGGTSIKRVFLTKGETVSCVVGSGGIAGTSLAINGGSGGTSSFGLYCSATGGNGSVSIGVVSSPRNYVGATGGIGINGDINLRGGSGDDGLANYTGDDAGGTGGSTFINYSAKGTSNGVTPISSGYGTGCPGVGCATNQSANGGIGSAGAIIIEW